MTALVTPPRPMPGPPPGPSTRVATITANLLPDSVIASRRLAVVKRNLALGLALLVLLVAAGYGYSWWQTSRAHDDLAAAQAQTNALNATVAKFAPLQRAEAEVSAIQHTLSTLMAGDVQWKSLLQKLRTDAPAGVQITAITATVATASASPVTTTPNPLNETGLPGVGTVTITGTAGDKRTVAAYADALAKVKGLVAPLPASVTKGGSGTGSHAAYTFSMSVSLTSAVFGGRYAPAAPASTNATAIGGN